MKYSPSNLIARLSIIALGLSLPLHGAQSSSTNLIELTKQTPIVGLKAPNRIAGQYIVTFKANTANETIKSLSNQINLSLTNKTLPTRQTSLFKGLMGSIPNKQLIKLQNHPAVLSIEVNRTIKLNSPIELSSSLQRNASVDSWGLDRIDQAQLPLDNSYSPQNQGTDVHAYIIDSGINIDHIDFGGRASWSFTATDINDGDTDGNGHGTHMAGIVGGNVYGVAKNVNLHAVKVVNHSGVGTLAGLIEGVEYVTNNHQSPAVATIAITTGFSQALDFAIDASINAGVTYAVPSGDYSQDACHFSPAANFNAITVAASWSDDRASAYSNHGNCINILAPGLYIKSDWPLANSANNTISHSPLSAAFVAGAAALILEQSPGLTPQQVKTQIIENSAANVLTEVPTDSPNLLLNVVSTNEPPQATRTGEHGNIALLGTNGLTIESYTASHTEFPSSDSPAGAFDGYFIHNVQMNDDATTRIGRGLWYGYGLQQWLQIDFGREVALTGFQEFHDVAPDHHIPEGCTIQVSDDGINFTDVQTFTNPLTRTTRLYQFTEPAVGRYIRYVSNDQHDYYFNMAELEYYGSFTGN